MARADRQLSHALPQGRQAMCQGFWLASRWQGFRVQAAYGAEHGRRCCEGIWRGWGGEGEVIHLHRAAHRLGCITHCCCVLESELRRWGMRYAQLCEHAASPLRLRS